MHPHKVLFPFLFGGTFIEALTLWVWVVTLARNFPSFSEGLSLRPPTKEDEPFFFTTFPFLFGGTFIEASILGFH